MAKKVKKTGKEPMVNPSLVPVYQTVPPTQNQPTDSEDIIDISSFNPRTGENISQAKSKSQNKKSR